MDEEKQAWRFTPEILKDPRKTESTVIALAAKIEQIPTGLKNLATLNRLGVNFNVELLERGNIRTITISPRDSYRGDHTTRSGLVGTRGQVLCVPFSISGACQWFGSDTGPSRRGPCPTRTNQCRGRNLAKFWLDGFSRFAALLRDSNRCVCSSSRWSMKRESLLD